MNALVLGAGGFIGSHMVSRLASEGFNVVGVDLKKPELFEKLNALIAKNLCEKLIRSNKK